MRYFMYAYLLIFFVSILINSILLVRAKANISLLIYEILAASYLMAVTLIYFTPGWMTVVNIWFCLLIVLFVITDIYMTVWGRDEWICPPGFKHTGSELELARIVTVIFVAPAYISGIMLLLQVWLKD
ncbi:MAG: hypothetical protein KAS17_09750 [Victivallaceae bacterium]|nr:hypothetical protein [Victivallaceae bacterium]